MSTLCSISTNKAFLFLKNIGILTSLGYPLPAIGDLANSTCDYIDDKSLRLFEREMAKSSDKRIDQSGRIIEMILPDLAKCPLRDVF